MQSIRARVIYAVGGVALLGVSVWVSASLHDALAIVIGAGGIALILYAAVEDRFESIGPSGAKFRSLQDRAASSADPATADAIARVTTLEELVDTLVARINRPETSGERMRRVQADERTRDTLAKLGGVRRDR